MNQVQPDSLSLKLGLPAAVHHQVEIISTLDGDQTGTEAQVSNSMSNGPGC